MWPRAPADLAGPLGLLASAWLTWLFVGAWAITPSSVLPLAMDAFGIGETGAAWIVTAPQVAATLTGIPIGMYLDRIDRGTGVLAAVGTLFVAGLLGSTAAAADAYWLLIGARALGGIALVTIWTAQIAIITRAFPVRRRATAVSVFVTGYPAGYAVGQFSAPLIADVLDWTATFGLYTGVGFAFGVVFWALGRGRTDGDASTAQPSLAELGRTLANPGVWGVAALSFFSYMLYMVVNGWMPTYIAKSFDLSLARSGLYAAVFPAIGILSRPSGGFLSDRFFGRRNRPVIALSFFLAGTGAVAMALGDSIAALLGGLLVAGFAIQLQFGLLYTFVQRLVPEKVGATAVAVVSTIGWFGIFAGPPVTGAFIETVGSFSPIFSISIALAAAGMVVVFLVSEPD